MLRARRVQWGSSVQGVKGVVAVVEEVHARAAGGDGQAKQGPSTGRYAGRVQGSVGDLNAGWGGLDDQSVSGVHREHVPVGGEGKAEGAVQVAARREVRSEG